MFFEFGAVMSSFRPREDTGDKGTVAGTAFWGVLSFTMEVPPEIAWVCDEEGRGACSTLTLSVAAGGGDRVKLPESVAGGRPDSALF
jgi:hypothetical protein